MNSWLPMSRYGMPSSSSSATSRSRSDNLEETGRDAPVRAPSATVVTASSPGASSIAAVGGLQGGLAGQSGGVPGKAELRQAPRRHGHHVGVDVIGQHPKPASTG